MHYDPVCKKKLQGEDVKAKCTYDRNTYYFCSVDCQERFVSDPLCYLGPGLWGRLSKFFSSMFRQAESH